MGDRHLVWGVGHLFFVALGEGKSDKNRVNQLTCREKAVSLCPQNAEVGDVVEYQHLVSIIEKLLHKDKR